MGTSSSYKGPVGKNPLLPPWADDNNLPDNESATMEDSQPVEQGKDNGNNDVSSEPAQPEVSWAGPKRVMSQIAVNYNSSIGAGSSLGRLGRSYVKASGGSRTASASARAGRRTAARLGDFLARGIREGFVASVERVGLGWLIGQDVNSVLDAFVDLLSPEAALREDIAARNALTKTLESLFEQYDLTDNGLEGLDSLDSRALSSTIQLYIANYINERIVADLANCIERKTKTEAEANRLMWEIRDFIKEIVTLDFSGLDLINLNWKGSQGRQFIEKIYTEAYSLVGDE